MVQKGNSLGAMSSSQDGDVIPVAAMVESIIGCKWSVSLLRLVVDNCRRPSEILRACPALSTKVMNERLKKMTNFGILRRTEFGEKPPLHVEYVLTPFGSRFIKILDEVRILQEAVDQETIADCGDISTDDL